MAYLQIFCLPNPNIDNTARAGTDLRLQVVASIFTLALQEAAPCPWPRLVHLLAFEVSTAPHSRLDPAPSAEAEAVSVCSGGLKRGSGVNLMIRGLNSHWGGRNSGHTGAAALQYLTMCKYFLSDYAVIFLYDTGRDVRHRTGALLCFVCSFSGGEFPCLYCLDYLILFLAAQS